jgi:hypothetical protein
MKVSSCHRLIAAPPADSGGQSGRFRHFERVDLSMPISRAIEVALAIVINVNYSGNKEEGLSFPRETLSAMAEKPAEVAVANEVSKIVRVQDMRSTSTSLPVPHS